MKQLTFQDLQNYLSLKYKEGRTSPMLFMKLVEEIGEVATSWRGERKIPEKHP